MVISHWIVHALYTALYTLLHERLAAVSYPVEDVV